MEANADVKINRKYKDRLFRFIFGAEENKRYLLSLYNAVNNSDYRDINEIEITTLEDVIYIKQKNDIAFLLDSELNLYEQQSSYNPNMPLRGMMYFADLYRQILSGKKKVREYHKEMDIKEAIDRAVDEAIESNYLDGFFRKHKEGVVNMSLTEYNEAEFVENRRAEGRAEGVLDTIIEFVKDGICPMAEGAKRAGMSIEDFKLLFTTDSSPR